MKKNKLVKLLEKLLSKNFIFIIVFYKKVISPYMLPSCRFLPTCSDYAIIACKKKGFFQGSYLTIKRLFRCHPLAKSKVDYL